jgi:serine/threonine-protein kinase
MTCVACGAEIDPRASACSACGTRAVSIVPGTLLAGRYQIQTLLGSGALGRVFRAHDRTLNEIVAIKILHPETTQSPELTQRFRNEIRLARRVRHVNVCAIHEYGEDGPVQFVAMEFVDGADLQRELRESGPLPAAEVFDVALQMARGLAAIHDAGVIHRDLKTSNIVRDQRGAVRLLDFGIAKRSSSTGTLALTGGERVVGTPEYMSPEQIRGADLDPRSDLYSFGVVLFELCTGTLPFEGKTPLDTMLRQVSEPPPLYGERASRIPPPLISLLRRALAKDAAGRPASARDLEAELLFAQTAALPESPPAPLEQAPSHSAPQPRPEPQAAGPTATPPVLSGVATRPQPDPADRTEVLPRKASPARPTPPPPPLLAARDAAAASALDGERTFIELPAIPDAPATPLRPPPVPDGEAMPPRRPGKARPPIALLAVVGLAVIGLALVVRARLAPDEVVAPVPAAQTPSAGAEQTPPSPAAQVPNVELETAPSPGPLEREAPTAAASPAAPSTPRPSPAATSSSAPRPDAVPAATATPRPARAALPPSPAPTPSPEATPTPAPTPPGRIAIDVRPRAEVEIDGRPFGRAPLPELSMEPGEHVIELSHPDYWPRRKLVVLFAGSLVQFDVDLAWEGVRRSDSPPYRLPGKAPADPELARAADLVAGMQWREADARLEAVVRRLEAQRGRRSDLARAHFYLGVAHLELGESTHATASFTSAVQQDSKLRPSPEAFPPRVLSFFNHVRTMVAARGRR